MIRNFRGIERADIKIDKIAFLAGRNRQGKSSICQAIQAAVTGLAIPFIEAGATPSQVKPLLAKSKSGTLVRTGMSDGKVAITGEDGMASVTWPDNEVQSAGQPPRSSPYAAGMIDFCSLDHKKRAAFLAELLDLAPTYEDLKQALTDEGVGEKIVDQLWKEIEKHGWDITHETAKDHGAKLKGQWEDVVSTVGEAEKYGTNKGDKWLPAGFEQDLTEASKDSLEAAVVAARQQVEEKVGASAVDDAQRARLESDAALAVPDIEALEQEHKEGLEELATIRVEREKLGPLTGDSGFPCPHCGELIHTVVKGPTTTYVKAAKVDQTDLRKRRIESAGLDGRYNNTVSKLQQIEREISTARALQTRSVSAKAILAAPEGDASANKALEAAREALSNAERRLKTFMAYTGARQKHRSILRNQVLIDALAPDGVRRTKIIRALEPFNKELSDLCATVGWKTVSVSPGMEVMVGSVPHFLMSASEQFLAKTLFQLAIATRDNSELVVIDAADIFDAAGRERLLKMVMKWDGFAVIAMTMNNAGQIPRIDKAQVGHGYWVDDGICMTHAEAIEKNIEKNGKAA